MRKIRKKAKAKAVNTVSTKGREESTPLGHDEDTDDGRVNYGGLPNRDLKKNLGGCG